MEARKENPTEIKYTKEDIQRLAPNYRGKPENFNPDPKARKPTKPPPKRNGPKSSELPPPTHLDANKNPTPQRNDPIISESIFGVDVSVTAIEPQQHFNASYAKLLDIVELTYQSMQPDVKQLDRLFTKEELMYYATAMLWIRLIDIKSKQRVEGLTSQEKDILKATKDLTWNVPQPIYAYLAQIGNVVDKMGKETMLRVPALPINVVEGFGGYHNNTVNLQTHTLFEEVPSLGIAADVIMASTQEADEPVPNFRIAIPPGAAINRANLCGAVDFYGPRRAEIRQRLAGQRITNTSFPEYAPNTRFHLTYLLQLSDMLSNIETFRIERMTPSSMTLHGGETMVIQTLPNEDEDQNALWTTRTVQAQSPASDSTAQIGAAYIFGFQLRKESTPEPARDPPSLATRSANWSCIVPAPTPGVPAWDMSVEWYQSRNELRNLPPGIGTLRFRAIGRRQDIALIETVRRMLKTK